MSKMIIDPFLNSFVGIHYKQILPSNGLIINSGISFIKEKFSLINDLQDFIKEFFVYKRIQAIINKKFRF